MSDSSMHEGSPSPFLQYMNTTRHGNSVWWTWLVGFWFAIVVWLYGQIFLGLMMSAFDPLAVSGGTEQDVEAVMQTMPSIDLIITYILAGIAPIIPIILWLARASIQSEFAKKFTIILSSLCIVFSTWAFAHGMINGPKQDPEFVTKLITASPVLYALILASFPIIAGGFYLVQKLVHFRPILALHTAWQSFRWKRVGFTMLVTFAILGAFSIAGQLTGLSPVEYVFDPKRFFGYFLVTLLFIPLQSATEEIVLRGYLNQGLFHYIKNPWIVFFITSAGFAALHLSNPEVAEGTKDTSLLITMSGYFLFGFFACILTYIDGGLESAIGMHAANNMFAATIVGYESSALPTPTIFRVGLNTELDSIITLAALSIICLVIYKTRARTISGPISA